MKELEKEIKRVKQVIENYEKEFDELKLGNSKAILRDAIIRSRGVLQGLERARIFLNLER